MTEEPKIMKFQFHFEGSVVQPEALGNGMPWPLMTIEFETDFQPPLDRHEAQCLMEAALFRMRNSVDAEDDGGRVAIDAFMNYLHEEKLTGE